MCGDKAKRGDALRVITQKLALAYLVFGVRRLPCAVCNVFIADHGQGARAATVAIVPVHSVR